MGRPWLFVGADKLERRQAARRELGLDPAAFVVATIGMLRPDKRQEDLLRVVHLLRQRGLPAHALVVGMPTRGTMAYGQKLHELVAELGIGGCVTFAGHREDIASVIHAADAVLVPSVNEAWSRVVPEAYAARCPVVASAVGDCRRSFTLAARVGWRRWVTSPVLPNDWRGSGRIRSRPPALQSRRGRSPTVTGTVPEDGRDVERLRGRDGRGEDGQKQGAGSLTR